MRDDGPDHGRSIAGLDRLAVPVAEAGGLGIAAPPARFDRLDELLLGLGDVGGPVGRVVLAEGLDVARLVLAGQPLQLVEDAVPQGLELLGDLAVAVMRRLEEPEPADPDLEPGVLLELAERGVGVEPGVDLVGQELQLPAGEVPLGVPEQAILGANCSASSGWSRSSSRRSWRY